MTHKTRDLNTPGPAWWAQYWKRGWREWGLGKLDCQDSPGALPTSREPPSPAVQHFTFALTDLAGNRRFGFCRLRGGAQSCLCILR